MLKLSGDLEKPHTSGPLPATESVPEELRNVPTDTVTEEHTGRIALLTEPKSPGADRFRYLRMRLRELAALVKLKTLVITSALPRDGKSTVALNLATALAERGRRRVLLIEADLHCPSILNTLGLNCPTGLAECLESGADPFLALRRLDPFMWYLLPAGQAVGNPTEILQSETFGHLIAKVSPHFDWVLVDTPPVEPLLDALLVAKSADASILVVRAGQTPQAAVDEAISLLGAQNIAAVVFNGAEGLNKLYSKYSGYYGRK